MAGDTATATVSGMSSSKVLDVTNRNFGGTRGTLSIGVLANVVTAIVTNVERFFWGRILGIGSESVRNRFGIGSESVRNRF